MIATEDQARKVIAAIYGPVYAESVRFVERHGYSIMMLPTWAEEIGLPILAWRKLESGSDATVWLGRYLGFDKDSAIFIDWTWAADSDPALVAFTSRHPTRAEFIDAAMEGRS